MSDQMATETFKRICHRDPVTMAALAGLIVLCIGVAAA